MRKNDGFARRGIVEGFFGPPWSMTHRSKLFAFGAKRGMNTYLYAPKDDPYHRQRWTAPYPPQRWRALLGLIRAARKQKIDFVYGFHPGKGLCFTSDAPVRILLDKAARFHDAGVRTFAVLFDDIPSRLEHPKDRMHFRHSLARAEGTWLAKVIAAQPAAWRDVEWWLCPSYYTPDPRLARVFGAFEKRFLDRMVEALPPAVACMWTGPAVVPEKISLSHVGSVARRLRGPLILWDNYPVNDLTMSDELHIGPLTGRDPNLPEVIYGYLNNPLLQEELSFLPLGTCFDYAAGPKEYDPETSWTETAVERFGVDSLKHWRAIRAFCDIRARRKHSRPAPRVTPKAAARFRAAADYIDQHRQQKWAREIQPWRAAMAAALQNIARQR